MSNFSEFNLETFILKMRRDVRTRFWVIFAVSILLIWPLTILGGFISTSVRSGLLTVTNIVQPKVVTLQEYVVSETQKSDLVGGRKLLYVTVNNKQNKEIGFWPWVYQIQVLDASGGLVQQEIIRTYLLPEEVKFVTVNTTEKGETLRITEIKDQTRAVIYNPQASNILKEPNVTIVRNELTDLVKNSNLTAAVTLRNNDNIFIEQMNLLYLVRDSRGAVVGGGTTTINGFASGTSRDLNIEYTKPLDRIPRTLEIRWSVNYLDPAAIRLP